MCVICPAAALADNKALIGAGRAAVRGGPHSLPCVGRFLRPHRPRRPGGGPQDRCRLGEVPAGPRVAPASGCPSSAELGPRRGVGGRRGAGPLVWRLPGQGRGGTGALCPSRLSPHVIRPLSVFTCRVTPGFLSRNARPFTRSVLCRRLMLHAPFSVQVCEDLLNACCATFTVLGVKNIKGIQFGFCFQRICNLLGGLSM